MTPRCRTLGGLATVAALVTATSSSGCSESISPDDPDLEVSGTGTGGFESGASADDTGAEPQQVEQDCLFDGMDGFYGLRYQCEGRVEARFQIDLAVGTDPDEPGYFYFGESVEGDSYEEPLVMACCPDFEAEPDADSWCAKPHEQACWVDLVEQSCKSLVTNIVDFAEDNYSPGGIPYNKTIKVAEYLAQNQETCLAKFLVDTAIATTPPECDEFGGRVFPYEDAIANTSWTFDPGVNQINSVTLTLVEAEMNDIYPVGSPTPSTCLSSDDNDHISFLETDPGPGSVKYDLVAGSVALRGPWQGFSFITGSGTFASINTSCTGDLCSNAAWTIGANGGSLDALTFYSNGPDTVASATQSVDVEFYRIRLYDTAPGTVAGGGMEIAAGDALFVISANDGVESRLITATNYSGMELSQAGSNWLLDEFLVKYEDDNGKNWTMTVGATLWQMR